MVSAQILILLLACRIYYP